MTDFKTVRGFEDVWRPTARTRFNLTPASLRIHQSGAGANARDVRARLARVAGGAPQVVVSLTGRRRNHGQLLAHLNYISRDGRLELEDRDGNTLVGRQSIRELADDWTLAAASDPRRRSGASLSLSLVLSMPSGTNPSAVRDAARAFGRTVFADQFDYAFVLHTDVDHPHVHLTVQTSDERGRFLKPWKTDLDLWRQVFAEALRQRGVEAEATPRAARGITRKTEHPRMRRIRERHEQGVGEPAYHVRDAYLEAASFCGKPRILRTKRSVARSRRLSDPCPSRIASGSPWPANCAPRTSACMRATANGRPSRFPKAGTGIVSGAVGGDDPLRSRSTPRQPSAFAAMIGFWATVDFTATCMTTLRARHRFLAVIRGAETDEQFAESLGQVVEKEDLRGRR